MEFLTYWNNLDADGKRNLAFATGTVVSYLSQIANGHRKCSQKFALKLESATRQMVTRRELRPDLNPVSARSAELISTAI